MRFSQLVARLTPNLSPQRIHPIQLWVRWVLALCLILALLAVSHNASLRALSSAEADASNINRSSQQMMLSQRILYLAHDYVEEFKPETRKLLADAVNKFEQEHMRLASIAATAPELHRLYFEGNEPIDRSSRAFIAAAHDIIVAPAPGQSQLEHLDEAGSDDFLHCLEVAVHSFEAVAQRKADELRNIQNWSLYAAVLIVLLETLIIFWPAQEAVKGTMRSLRAENDRKNASLRRLSNFASLAADLFWEADQHGRITYLDGQFLSVLRSGGEPLIGKDYRSVVSFPDEELDRIRDASSKLLPYTNAVCTFVDDEGRHYKLEMSGAPLFDTDDAFMGYFGTVDDVTERLAEVEKVTQLAKTDALTGLGNRRALDMQVSKTETKGHVAEGYCLIAIDLDEFKPVNDIYGHGAGDEALKLVAQRIQGLIRATDTAFRTGGDEFCVICPGLTTLLAVEALARRLQRHLALPYNVGEAEVHMSASIGVALARPGEMSLQAVMQAADAALYQAKRDGRNRIRYADQPDSNQDRLSAAS